MPNHRNQKRIMEMLGKIARRFIGPGPKRVGVSCFYVMAAYRDEDDEVHAVVYGSHKDSHAHY